MKLLTITVPCYNSEPYMQKCIDSLLPGGDDVEIIIVDDGSDKDRTAEIADAYQEKYPSIVKVIHQPNKGHGGAINTGIDHATGVYFKVVDSDDWLDGPSFEKVLEKLREFVRNSDKVDVLFSNYVYEKQDTPKKRVMRYPMCFPQDKIFEWKEMRPMAVTHYVLMHSIIYRTAILHEVDMRLPEHTYYEDNLYAFVPFPAVKKMYYLDVNLYRYFIGRADQSVNMETMQKRVDQQLLVNNMMIDYYCQPKMHSMHPRQKAFMMHALAIMLTISSVILIQIDTPESLEKKKKLWARLRKGDAYAYFVIRTGFLGMSMNLPGEKGRQLIQLGYRIARRLYGFN